MADPNEIDLTSEVFHSPQYVSFQFKLQQLPDIVIRDVFIYKRTEYAAEVIIMEQNSSKLWVRSNVTSDLIKGAHEDPLRAEGLIGPKWLNKCQSSFPTVMFGNTRKH